MNKGASVRAPPSRLSEEKLRPLLGFHGVCHIPPQKGLTPVQHSGVGKGEAVSFLSSTGFLSPVYLAPGLPTGLLPACVDFLREALQPEVLLRTHLSFPASFFFFKGFSPIDRQKALPVCSHASLLHIFPPNLFSF